MDQLGKSLYTRGIMIFLSGYSNFFVSIPLIVSTFPSILKLLHSCILFFHVRFAQGMKKNVSLSYEFIHYIRDKKKISTEVAR